MKKFPVVILLLFSTFGFAQHVVEITDSLLLDAEYTKALEWIESNRQKVSADDRLILANRKAEALIHLGKFAEAEKLLDSTINKRTDNFAKGVSSTTYGLLYLNQGRNDKALEVLQQAIGYFESATKASTLEASQALTYLGLVYNATGKNVQAEEQLKIALALRQNILKKEKHELIAASYNDLGLVYASYDYDKALEYYEKAMAIYESLHGKQHAKIAIASINIGFIYGKLELYGDATNNFETALKIWEKIYPQAHPTKAFALFNLGETYTKIGNAKAAKGYYDRALQQYRESYGEKHPEISVVLNALGNHALTARKYHEAIRYYQQALISNVSDFNDSNEEVNPPLRNYYNGNVLLYSLLLKAQAFEARHYGQTLKFSDLKTSIRTLQQCDSLADRLRQQSTNENDKIALGVIANEVYSDGVRIAHGAAQVAFSKKPFEELSFYFAEKSKSAVLLEAISESDAKSFAGIPADLLEQERNLKSELATTAQKLAQKPSPGEEQYLRAIIYSLNRSYEAFTKRLEKEFPQYFNLKFNASSPSIAQLQSLISAKAALLSYFIDEKNNRLYVFIITKNKFEIVDHPLPAEFNKYISGLQNSLFYNEINAYTNAANKLSQLLIPKQLPSSVSDLVILSTGRLSIVPFETLFTKKVNEISDYRSLPYLVKKYNVRYEFSAGLLLQKAKDKEESTSPSIFLCAPVTFQEKDQLNDLPGTESEVQEISKLFATKNLHASMYTGAQATEDLVKSKELEKHNLLHFATHGVVDQTHPELSRIFLQSTSGGEDGNLFSGEIYNLQLKADLVTLSACQTGLGKISKGEGVVGLSRALVYAGAKNIIVSFWSVADDSTAELMKDFYRKLLDNSSANYSTSLREAKLKLIDSDRYAAPYYWAPFILIGF